MPSKTDFNVSPYYDDFSEAKKFHRVMYRPAFAVQARELTTQQSITQNQIEKMGDHLFNHGAMVIPGETHLDKNYRSVKLTSFTGTLNNFVGNTVTGGTSGVVAKVVAVTATDGTDPDTLFVKYKNSGTDNTSITFTDDESLTSNASTGETAVVSATEIGAAFHIDAGTYYINGFFVDVTQQTLILDKYDNIPSYRIGLTISESFITSTDDTSLLDNATGSSNENATGAHRFKIDLTLAKLSLDSTADASFVELARVENGIILNKVTRTEYNILEDTLARRTFDESGDYYVDSFDIDVRESLLSGTNRGVYTTGEATTGGVAAAENLLSIGMGEGVAYVKGYEVRKLGTTFLDLEKARDFEVESGEVTRFAQIPFVNVTNLFGTPDVGFVSDETEVYKKVRLLDTEHSTRGTALVNNDGTVFDIGRAKSRGIEYNSGTASDVFMSSALVTDNTYKQYLFDTVMFAHLNVRGPASASLTTGETLTGGTSGATGIVESITSLGAATITGITQANPPVVTCSGGHNFTEGQIIKITSVSGMTDVNNGFFTVKNPSATTFELFTESTAAIQNPSAVNGTGFTAYTSGGSAAHTIVILSNVNGEFVEGETATGGSSSSTAVVQFDSYGCKGFEQKEFTQTKGISMAGSPVYTANVDLTSTFGDEKQLSGTISTVNPDLSPGSIIMDAHQVSADGDPLIVDSQNDSIILEDATETGSAVIAIGLEDPADQADVIVGSATRFLTELKLGDQITFEDDSNTTVTRIVQSIHSNTRLETAVGLGTTSATSKIFKRQRTKIQSPENDRALFKLPYDVVKTLLTTDNDGISDTSFKIRRQFVSTLSSSGTATLTAGTNEVFSAHSENDVTVSIMAKGGSATAGEVGDVITLSNSGDYTLGGSPTGKTLTIDLGSTFNASKIKVLATISASVIGAKTKTNNADTTKTIDTQALAQATTINIGKADVHKLTSVFMAADFSTAATTSDTDVTDRFDLDTGQRDNFYDIARLVRKAGKAAPTGRLLITFDFFTHGTGNFFSVDSYSGFDYGSIPAYTSDVTGEVFELRDCLDFRPRVDDASTIDAGDGQDRQYSGTGASTIEFPKFNTDITADLEFFLAKKARVFLAQNGQFLINPGESAINPAFPQILPNAMHLYDLFLPPYTFKTSDVEVTKIDNKRYTMRDIGRLENRIENIEYYTQLSLLESEAQNMQIQDADGFDRFKNGIIVDNFTGHGIADVSDSDYSVSMDMAQGELRPAFSQDNASLIEIQSDLSTTATDTSRATAGYQKTGDLITLPYTSYAHIDQPYASTTVNVNPFDTTIFTGIVELDPAIDEWFDTETKPDLVVTVPGTYDTLTDLASQKVLDLNLGTVWNNWNDSWLGNVQALNRRTETRNTNGKTFRVTTVDTEQRVGRTRAGIRTSLVPNTVRQSLGDRVLNVTFAQFIRQKSISFTATGLRPDTTVFPFFDDINISSYVTPTGSSAGSALTTNAQGNCSGIFVIPDPKRPENDKWRTGRRTFRLTSSSVNMLTGGDLTTAAETEYVAKGLVNTIQGTILSTREAKIAREDVNESTTILRRGTRDESIIEVNERRNQGGGNHSGTPGVVIIGGKVIQDPKANQPGGTGSKWRNIRDINPQINTGNNRGNHHPPSSGGGGRDTSSSTNSTRSGTGASGPPGRNYSSGNNCGWRDPVAQSFKVDTLGGIFVNSVDLFFSAKSTTLPVTVQLRTMFNGYPTREIIPFGEVSVAASDINTSTDASESTTFTFPSPVYIKPNQEYCFVVLANTDEFTIYTARLGQTTLDGARFISKQPYLGSMFKSQNGSTWSGEQNEDVKFKLNACSFTTDTFGNVNLVNDELPTRLLPKTNPISTTDGSAVITVHCPNHGMHSTSANVTISGLASGTHNGIASTNINGTYTTIGNIKFDSFTVTAANSDIASATGDIGGTDQISITRNMLFDVIQPVIGSVVHDETSILAGMRTTSGRSLEGSETEYSLDAVAKTRFVTLNQDYYMTSPGLVASAINETNEMSGVKSFAMRLDLFTPTHRPNLSPVIDTKRLSLFLIQNRLNNPIDGTTPDFVEETTNTGGSAAAKYMTKPVILQNNSTSLDIRLSANVRSTSAIKMYYRATSAEDVRLLGDVPWRAFNSDGTSDSAVTPALDDITFREHKFSVSDLPAFTAFSLKVVMTGSVSSYPPLIKDMRGIALAV